MNYKSKFVPVMVVVILAAMAVPFLYAADAGDMVPIMRRAEPPIVKAGAVVTVFGQALDKARVSDVMLTTASKQIPVDVIEQTESFIKFRVPADVEPGKYNPAVLMVKEPMVLVQPVILTVEARDGAPKPELTK